MFDNVFVALSMVAVCLYGYPAALAVNPGINGNRPHLLSGSYLFPNITIRCSGRVAAFHFSGYFNPGVRYNSTISILFASYTLSGSQYKLETGINLHMNLEWYSQSQPSLRTDGSGRYYVLSPLVVYLSSKLSAPLHVSPGYILGISVPPTQSLPSAVVSLGVSIMTLDDPGSQTMSTNNSYRSVKISETWSSIQGRTPMVQLEFTEEGNESTDPSFTINCVSVSVHERVC